MDSKLPDVGTTIFTVMSQLAQDCDAINLSQGFPSFEPDPVLLRLVDHHLQSGANQYAPMPGVPSLRQAVADKVAREYGNTVDPDTEVTICTGATEGLYSAITASVRSDDEVIVFDPAYDSYEPAVTLSGGTTVHIPLNSEAGQFGVDWQKLQDAITPRTRLVILNFPHNPTGAILSADDLDVLAGIIRDHDIFLLADEVYEHIVFDDIGHQSLLRHDELRERAFVVSSFGKTCHATGWKIGYCVAPAALTTEFRKIHQFTSFAIVTPMQHALADYMTRFPTHYRELGEFYRRKRDTFIAALEGSRFGISPARSTFFQIVDYSAITHDVDTDYAKHLTQSIGVASIPVSVFYASPPQQFLLRFCFAKDDSTLEEAGKRLCNL